MCNLYTSRLSRDEVASLFRHRELIGTNFKDEQSIYPNGEAPAMVLEADGRVAVRDMVGLPQAADCADSGYVTNVRNTACKPAALVPLRPSRAFETLGVCRAPIRTTNCQTSLVGSSAFSSRPS
jgi:hypothetical protein